MQGMRRPAGILLTLVGAIMLAIYGFVMMRLPIPGFLLSRLGNVSLWVDPVGGTYLRGCIPNGWDASAATAQGETNRLDFPVVSEMACGC